MATPDDHYLKKELYDLLRTDDSVFDFLQRASLDGLWYWDLESPEHEWMSPEFWQTLGYDPATKRHLVEEWQDLIHPDDLKVAINNSKKHIEDPSHPYDQVVRYTHKNGSTVWVRCRGIAIRDENGKPIRMLGAHNEITQLKQAEEELQHAHNELERKVEGRTAELTRINEALHQSRDAYQAIIETTNDWIWSIDLEGKHTYSNPAIKKILGYTAEELIGVPSLDFIHDDDRQWVKDKLAEWIRKNKGWTNQVIRWLHKDGSFRYLESNAVPHFDEEGKLVGFRGVDRDITDRIEAETLLRTSEQRFRDLVESSSDWIWEVDKHGVYTYASPKVEELLGYKPGDVLGKKPFDLMPPGEAERVGRIFAEIITKQRAFADLENINQHKDGRLITLETSGIPIFDEEGRLVGYRGIDRDITDRKHAEEAVKEREMSLTALFDSAVDGILLADPLTSEFISCNKSMAKMLGYRVEEVVGLKVKDLHREEDFPFVFEQFELITTEKSTEATNIPFQRKDGSLFYVDVTGFPFVMAGKRYIGGFFRDVTGRIETEKQLKQAAVVFENASEGVVITDAKRNIVAVNKSFTEISGYTEEEVLGKNPRLWKSQHHDDSFYQAMWSSLHETGEWRGEIWNRRKNGNVYPAWMTINAVRDEQGRLTNFVSVFTDISAIKQSQEKLHQLAHYDVLTDLPNRLLFNDRLEHALERASRENRRVGVLFLDLDNFKPINDGLGHPVGDKVLQAVGQRLRTLVRGDDTVARIAGDEFAIILEEVSDSQGIAQVASKIVSAFELPLHVEDHELHVTMTIGISIFPEDGGNAVALVKNADAAMYRAKERGKSRYCFYTLDLTEAALERLQIENELRAAIKQQEFSVYYQPQYSLTTGQLTGAEALVRWQHPENGLISPDRFIPLAESTGLIVPLGAWVLRVACIQTKAWLKAGYEIQRIAVNVAGQQIQHSGFVNTVRTVLQETRLDPQCLELEVTESFIMEQSGDAIKTLEKLRSLGVHLAIDDFGTGYSSLSYLKRLPINKLKVDRSFVRDIPQDTDDEAITKAVIAMGKSLQLKIVAEGVETEEQLSFLRSEGCDEVQGYLYSPPVPEEDFIALLNNTN